MTNDIQTELNGHEQEMFLCGRRYYANVIVCDTFDELTTENLAEEIYFVFAKKWERWYNVMRAKYNPLENYNMQETYNDFGKQGGETTDYSGVGESETGVSGTGQTIRAGKNITDVTYNNNVLSVSEQDGATPEQIGYKTTYDNTEQDRKTDSAKTHGDTATKTLNAYNVNRSKSGTESHNIKSIDIDIGDDKNLYGVSTNGITSMQGHKGERTGNIGVTTSQQMLQQELTITDLDLFITIIVRDIAEHIGTGCYA